MRAVVLASLAPLALCLTPVQLPLVKEYSGAGFFDDWQYFGAGDNFTDGNVIWVNQSLANQLRLTQVNTAGNAVVKVDTSAVVWDNPRNSVRITTNDFFEIGTIFVIDVVHIPFGCSVWPSIWTTGQPWPENGEIDIIESVNLMGFNQMSLHTTSGCFAAAGTDQTGSPVSTGSNCSQTAGCGVKENKPNSFGANFAQNRGGAWVMQFDVSGIFIWFFQRSEIPQSIVLSNKTLTVDTDSWGPPSAAFVNGTTCNISNYFQAQQIVIDITLCGNWAGMASVYNQTGCGAFTNNTCYLNNVLGNGQNYANAYFEVSYIRAFSSNPNAIFTTTASAPAATPTTSSGSGDGGDGAVTNGGDIVVLGWPGFTLGFGLLFLGLLV
ncbi:glycoside hydrolase family 16 protein [Phlebiopsis gigantea 11061_1 CR5-6]|uniref:Glycoside hydrolase family 16 protein n=1 Tax=Phlebiopsis gigantea (strain 11061_1 CR5-6) TaxID=745531 RepID=A0A0C3RY07_PHLG1|nr:glycoside hydrolase family 16 protein [Phlebiopsis gigantea 11061_1 CR5-6]